MHLGFFFFLFFLLQWRSWCTSWSRLLLAYSQSLSNEHKTCQHVSPAVLLSIPRPPCPGEPWASTGTSGIWCAPRNAPCVLGEAVRPEWAPVCLWLRATDKGDIQSPAEDRVPEMNVFQTHALNPAKAEKTRTTVLVLLLCLFALISPDHPVCKWLSARSAFEISA